MLYKPRNLIFASALPAPKKNYLEYPVHINFHKTKELFRRSRYRDVGITSLGFTEKYFFFLSGSRQQIIQPNIPSLSRNI